MNPGPASPIPCPKALRIAMAFIMVFGVAGGSLTPLVVKELIRAA
jgi:hypothetical protein